MTPVGLLGWALAGSAALVLLAVGVALAVVIVGSARDAGRRRRY